MSKTAIIVPCFNESSRLKEKEFVNSILSNKNLSYFFVNDGSTDNTLRKLTALCQRHPRQLHIIDLKTNHGKAEAVRQGFLQAMQIDFANVGYWDADLSTPLYVIDRFCQMLENSDFVLIMGSRVKLLGRKISRSTMRHYLGRTFATCASVVLNLPIYDTQCGAKLFRNTDELKSVFSEPFKVKWIFDVEILARLKLIMSKRGGTPLNICAVEYPLEEWTDVPGSKLRWHDFLSASVDLFKIFFYLRLADFASRRKKILKPSDH